MFTCFFTGEPVRDWQSAKQADASRYATFFRALLENGVYLAPSQFEAGFFSTAHGDAEIEQSIRAAGLAFQEVARQE